MDELFNSPNMSRILLVVLKHNEIGITDIQKKIPDKSGTHFAAYCGIKNNVERLKEMGLLKTRMKGRRNMVSLTPKGELTSGLIEKIYGEA